MMSTSRARAGAVDQSEGAGVRARACWRTRGILAAVVVAMVAATAAPTIAADPQDPPSSSVSDSAVSREALLEERLQRMEAMNRKMAEQFEAVIQRNEALENRLQSVAGENQALADKIDELTKRLAAPSPAFDPRIGRVFAPQLPPDIQTDEPGSPSNRPFSDLFGGEMMQGGGLEDLPPDIQTDEPMTPAPPGAPTTAESPEPLPASVAPGGEEPAASGLPPDIQTDEPEPDVLEVPTRTFFLEGFKFETRDSEFTLQFHNETQFDIRAYEQAASDPVNQVGFYVPRMRLFFNGRMTKPIEYSVSVNKGLGSFDLLDAYLDFNYDTRFQLRVGRYRVPYTYDMYALSNVFLTAPERSVFALNYGYSRNLAIMGHGNILGERLDYAVAAANGPRNSYYDSNAHKDVLAYIDYRPFFRTERFPFLRDLDIGGSMAFGIQDQAPLPVSFRTSASASTAAGVAKAAPAFLTLDNNVLERGTRELWEIHGAYFYKGLSLMGAWDKGYNTYGHVNSQIDVRVPTDGFHVAAAYLITGETLTRRSFVAPIRPFDLRKGRRGPGAIELQARYAEFGVGDEIFTGGFADPNLWANRVQVIDAGFNWYLNKYMKVYFDWQHSIFNQPVTYRPGGWQKTSDLFWLRFQLFF